VTPGNPLRGFSGPRAFRGLNPRGAYMSGTIGISGIASGVDWRNIIEQLRTLEYKKIELVQNQQQTAQDRLSAWQSINTKLLSLKTVVGKINEPADFNLFSPTVSSNTSRDPDDLLSVTAGTSASRGTYNIVINSLAVAHKLSSESFTSDTTALGLSGDLILNGKTVTVSTTDTLSSLQDKINAVNTGDDPSQVTASVVHYSATDHRLILSSDVEGVSGISLSGDTALIDALGLRDIRGVTGDIANTSSGAPITSATRIRYIDGYDYDNNEKIFLTGTSTSGAAVNTQFTISNLITVGNLLTAIQNAYGDVTAEVTAEGKIRVLDNETGDTQLDVKITCEDTSLKFDNDPDGDFGPITGYHAATIQAGADASFTLDGVAVTRSSNTIDDLITGVTLNLKAADPATTLTVKVNRDYEGLEEQITEFVTAYNDLMDTINEQLTYDTATQTPGGPLFGDSTLRALRSSLLKTIVNQVPGLDENFSTLGLVGINLSSDGKLTINSDTLQGYLETNFEDVKNLFVASATSTNGSLTYIDHNYNTQAGTYNLNITGVGPVRGYFATAGDASGSGEYLTGISGNAQGLVVRYSGTATGSIGSMTINFGVAELLERSLYRITDSTYGYLPDKQEAIQETINGYDERIATMEARLDKKMEELEARFVAMEIALSSMQSLSGWLSGQINSMNSIWA
jgi:flagellar capping protein FliD